MPKLPSGFGDWIHVHERGALILVLGAAGLLLLINALSRPIEYYGPDGEGYERLGDRAARAPSLFACDNFEHAYWSPGWIATIGAIYRVTGHHPRAIRVFLVLTALATAAMLHAAARRVAGRGAALLAVVLFLFSNLVFRFTAYFQYEVPLAFLVALFGLLLFDGRETDSFPRFTGTRRIRIVAAGAVAGAAALISPRVLIFIPLVLACWLMGRNVRRMVHGGLLLGAGLLLVLAPWTVHNYRCHGELIFTTTNGGVNLYIGNNPYTTGGYYMPPEDVRPGYALHESALWSKEALGYIAAHPLKSLGRSCDKAFQLWKPHYGDQAIVLIAYLAGWIRLLRWRHRPVTSPGVMWTLFAPFAMTIVHMVFFAQVRYMIPMLPFVCTVAGAGIAGWRPVPSFRHDADIRPPAAGSQPDEKQLRGPERRP